MKTPLRLTSSLLAISLLAACAGSPPPEIATPAPELSDEFFFTPPQTATNELSTLLPLGDPAFDTLASIALEKAPTLQEALARIDEARGRAANAGAQLAPRLDVDSAVQGTRINPNQFGDGAAQGGFIETEQLSYGANLAASWDPDIFGELRARERAAIARVDAASASARSVRNALIAEISGTIIDWRTLGMRAAALEDDVEAARDLARLAKIREDAGIAPGFDRIRAEAVASASRSRLAGLESERARIIGRLITLTGAGSGTVIKALGTVGSATNSLSPPSAMPAQLLQNRPDILAAAAQLAASDADLAATARSRFPRITLSAVVGLLAFDIDDLFDESSIIGTLTAGIAGPLLDFGRIDAEIDAAAGAKRAAFAAYRGAVFTALGEAETAYGLIAASDKEARLALDERDALSRAARIADTRYRAGLASFLDVLEARRAADASGERAAAATGRAMRARVLLWQALGGGEIMGEKDAAAAS